MIYLLLSITVSSILYVIFKLFTRFNIRTPVAIVVNYIVAFVYGISYADKFEGTTLYHKPWFMGAVLMGVLFILIFNVMAITAQKNGLSVASVSSKMSVVVPVIAAVILYNESLGQLKIIAIITALMAVYLTSIKHKGIVITKKNVIFPVLLFLGSGIIDTVLNYTEKQYVSPVEIPLYSATIFGCAASIGIGFLIYSSAVRDTSIRYKDIIGGFLLGIPNYYSIHFLLKALKSEVYSSSAIFIINNVGVVLLTTFLGILLFKERLLPKNWIGIVLALISILLIALSK